MDMARMLEMIEDFSKMPPVYEIARVQILMPGDEGYKKKPTVSKQKIDQAMAQMIRPAGKEPEWMRNARLKRERQNSSMGATMHRG